MNARALTITPGDDLPSLLDRACAALAGARTSAELLESRDMATFAYDAAKLAGRFARVTAAHDDILDAIRRSQADALEIEATAKRRLADEYDAAQQRGDLAGHGGARNFKIPDENVETPRLADTGLTAKDIFEARQIRDAEAAEPGIVRQTLDGLIEHGEEPTRAAVTKAINYRASSGNNEWFTPDKYVDLARDVLGTIDLDPASHRLAQETVRAGAYFAKEEDGLKRQWHGRVWLNPPYSQPDIGLFVDKLVVSIGAGSVSEAILPTNNSSDTDWFQKAARAASCVCFTKGRIKFVPVERGTSTPLQGQAFFYFGPHADRFADVFSSTGLILWTRAPTEGDPMSALTLGIDIGVVGAIATIDAAGALVDVVDMPVLADGPAGRRGVNAPLLAEIVFRSHATAAFVEFVGARPGEGAVGAFAFGRSRGVVEGVLGAAGIPLSMITPPSWKRAVGIPPGRDGAKDAARAEAIRRWPAHAALFARVKDDGRAEAALIAVAGMLRKGGAT